MPPEYVGAIDQGTTGTRFVIVDRDGNVVESAYETHEQFYPQPGWVEHDPTEIWENTTSVVERALSTAGVDAGALAAIGVTNQRETTLGWERSSGNPIGRAIVWQDRRTAERVEELVDAGREPSIRRKTGLPVDAYFSATKLEWLLDERDLRSRAAAGEVAFGTIDAWLLFCLTGAHVTDVTNASRTMLFDIESLEWDDDLLAEFGVPRAMLPGVRPSIVEEPYGYTDPDLLGAEIPVTAALGDQQAALFGQTCFARGESKNTYGTGSFVLMNTGTEPVESERGLLATVAFQRAGEPARYALEGSIFATGAAIEWLVEVGLIVDVADTEAHAARVDSTDGVYLVPAFSGLGAPHWDGRARGTIVGLTRGTRREHLVRAALESTAFQTRDVLEAMEAESGTDVPVLRVDGGAVRNDVLCQLQADLVGTEAVRPTVTETTALGAAYAAGLAVDYWTSLDDLRDHWQVDRRFTPRDDAHDADRRHTRWLAAVERSKGWAIEE